MRDAFEEKRERDTKKKKRENRKEDDAGTKEKKIQISSLSRGGLSSFALDDTEYTRDTFILFRVVIICLEEDDMLFFNVV
jgi:hypothetical protein